MTPEVGNSVDRHVLELTKVAQVCCRLLRVHIRLKNHVVITLAQGIDTFGRSKHRRYGCRLL